MTEIPPTSKKLCLFCVCNSR